MTEQAPEKDFATLQREAQERWASLQHQAAIRLQEDAAMFATSPDVLMRPDPGVPWSYEGVACACGGLNFLVQRWVTVNGRKHRLEAICTSCQTVRTWDWAEKRWV